ncbi:unnamed protein product, partial [Urochloa humidicola]
GRSRGILGTCKIHHFFPDLLILAVKVWGVLVPSVTRRELAKVKVPNDRGMHGSWE